MTETNSLKGESKFGLFVTPDAELADALNELLEIDLPVAVLVEDVYHSLEIRPILIITLTRTGLGWTTTKIRILIRNLRF